MTLVAVVATLCLLLLLQHLFRRHERVCGVNGAGEYTIALSKLALPQPLFAAPLESEAMQPVISARHITDRRARHVSDPFFVVNRNPGLGRALLSAPAPLPPAPAPPQPSVATQHLRMPLAVQELSDSEQLLPAASDASVMTELQATSMPAASVSTPNALPTPFTPSTSNSNSNSNSNPSSALSDSNSEQLSLPSASDRSILSLSTPSSSPSAADVMQSEEETAAYYSSTPLTPPSSSPSPASASNKAGAAAQRTPSARAITSSLSAALMRRTNSSASSLLSRRRLPPVPPTSSSSSSSSAAEFELQATAALDAAESRSSAVLLQPSAADSVSQHFAGAGAGVVDPSEREEKELMEQQKLLHYYLFFEILQDMADGESSMYFDVM
jgi:hypothetical protein